MFLLIFGCLLLSACASLNEVKRENRDLSNSYDGAWVAVPEPTILSQQSHGWQFTCQQLTAPISLDIDNSGVKVFINFVSVEPLKEAYISSSGKFRTSLPSDVTGKTSLHSDINQSDVEIRFIVEGKLVSDGTGSGSFTVGYEMAAFGGCKTKMNFTRDG